MTPKPLNDLPFSNMGPSPSMVRTSSRHSTSTFRYSSLTPEQTSQELSTDLSYGLSSAAASDLLNTYGPNEFAKDESEPLWLRFLKQFQETLILLLLASAAISFIMGNFNDAISITVAVSIVVTVGFIQEFRSEKSIEALKQLVPPSAHVIRADTQGIKTARPSNRPFSSSNLPINDSIESLKTAEACSMTIPASQLVVGDLVLFHTGDRIPADIRITHASGLTIDESNLTGENKPVAKNPRILNPPNDDSAFGRHPMSSNLHVSQLENIAFMGTLVCNGYGSGIVVATGSDTEFGVISASLNEIESPRTPLQESMDKLGKDLSYMSFGVIAFIVVVGLLRGWKFLDMFTIGVSLAVAAIPEGLPIIVTVTLALGVFRMSKHNAIVRRLPSVETLGSVNVICTDKTGTLTMNRMTVAELWHFNTNNSISSICLPTEVSQPLDLSKFDEPVRAILRIGNVVNNGRLLSNSQWAGPIPDVNPDGYKSRWTGHPTDVALLNILDFFGESDVRERLPHKRDEVPFTSDRKWMGSLIQHDINSANSVAYMKGAFERVLDRCSTYLAPDGKELPLDATKRKEAYAAAEMMAEKNLRVLGFASGNVRNRTSHLGSMISRPDTPTSTSLDVMSEDTYRNLTFAGLVGMYDPPRPSVKKSIQDLRTGRVRVIMITGDSEITAAAIARELGILLGPASPTFVMSGDRLDQLSDIELQAQIKSVCVFARTSPDHKMRIVRALQESRDVVAMTGDGVNDAPALKKADIGISMGKSGTDVAKEAADMILMDDDFSTILAAIQEGKGIFYNIQNFISFQLSTSAAALGLVLISTLAGYHNPLNAMQILWINILMDGPPAQSLGVEPVDPAVMKQPPRSRFDPVLTSKLLTRVFQSAVVIMAGTLLVYIREMAADGAVTARDTTMTFTCFVLFDMFNALSCRSESKSILNGEIKLWGFGSNKMFNYAVCGSLLGQVMVVYFPPLQNVFQTEAIGIMDWFFLAAIASTVFWVDEARKWHLRLSAKRSGMIGGYSVNV